MEAKAILFNEGLKGFALMPLEKKVRNTFSGEAC